MEYLPPVPHKMKRLFILRHAKSSWAEADLADFDRPLNDRGLRTAPLMGRYAAEHGYVPEAVVSSPARRARETAEMLKSGAGINVDIRFDDRIYEASPGTLFQVISEIDDTFASVVIVGHNPGMEGLIRQLTGQIEPMPTAALAVIDLDVNSWRKIAPGTGRVVTVARPKALM